MSGIDDFSLAVFEQAKRFLEKAKASDDGIDSPNLNAALLLGFCAFEGHLNSLADELALRPGLSAHELSILRELEVTLKKGEFVNSTALKMYRLDDRIEFIFQRFANVQISSTEVWWGNLKVGIRLRNQLVHPKVGMSLKVSDVERALQAILDSLDNLYRAVFGKKYPRVNRGLVSKLSF